MARPAFDLVKERLYSKLIGFEHSLVGEVKNLFELANLKLLLRRDMFFRMVSELIFCDSKNGFNYK